MSEQTKNKPNTAEIVVSIICVLILIVTLGLFARNVINAAREDESRRQSEADESLYRHDTADAEQLRLREAFAAVCKKNLKKYPSIQVVIDLHRDGVNESTKLVTRQNGKRMAQIMFFNGMSRTATNTSTTKPRTR